MFKIKFEVTFTFIFFNSEAEMGFISDWPLQTSDCLFLSKQMVLVQKSAADVNRTNVRLLIDGLK